MVKYSEEFKINVVNEYMKGPLGYKLLAEKHDIPITRKLSVGYVPTKNLEKLDYVEK